MGEPKQSEFERIAAEPQRGGILRELWGFVKENRKWWLLPLLIVLLLFGILIALAGTGVAPFVYTFF